MDNLKIGSLNVRGLRDVNKRKCMFNFFHNEKLDIVCIQESHLQKKDMWLVKKQWGSKNKVLCSHGETNARGVMTLIKSDSNIKVLKYMADSEGQYCITELQCEQRQIVLVNIYAPNEDRPEFFTQLFEDIAKIENANIMIVGDFNLVMNPKLDRKDGRRYSPNSFKVLETTVEELDMVDV